MLKLKSAAAATLLTLASACNIIGQDEVLIHAICGPYADMVAGTLTEKETPSFHTTQVEPNCELVSISAFTQGSCENDCRRENHAELTANSGIIPSTCIGGQLPAAIADSMTPSSVVDIRDNCGNLARYTFTPNNSQPAINYVEISNDQGARERHWRTKESAVSWSCGVNYDGKGPQEVTESCAETLRQTQSFIPRHTLN